MDTIPDTDEDTVLVTTGPPESLTITARELVVL